MKLRTLNAEELTFLDELVADADRMLADLKSNPAVVKHVPRGIEAVENARGWLLGVRDSRHISVEDS